MPTKIRERLSVAFDLGRCDSPASNRSQTSDFSNADNRRITNLLDEKPILAISEATTP